MKAKYCIVPDKNKFFAFLAEQSLTEAELLRARLIQPEKIFMDIEAAVWQIEYKAVAPVTETLLAAVANKLTAAFNLKKVELQQTNLRETSVVAKSVKTENKLETENKSVQVEPEREEIPLPPQYLRVRQSVKTMLMKRLITFSMEGIKKQTALFLVKHLKVSPGR